MKMLGCAVRDLDYIWCVFGAGTGLGIAEVEEYWGPRYDLHDPADYLFENSYRR